MTRSAFAVFAAFALLPATALAIPVNLQIDVLDAPPLDLGPRTSVAVAELEGWRADDVRSAIVGALMDGERGPTVFVEDPAGAPGGILISGTLADLDVHDEMEDISVQRDKGPVTVTEVDHVLTRTVTINFEMTATDVDTGELRGTQHFDISMQHKGKQVTNPEKAFASTRGSEEMATEMLEQFGYRVANYVTPRWESTTFDLEKNKTTATGVNMAKQEADLVGATDWFVRNAAKDPYDEFLQYNAAVLLAIGHHYAAAEEHLARARAIKERPRYRMFEGRLSKLAAGHESLAAMGVEQPPIAYEGTAGALADADTVTVKGGRNKRIPLTEEPGSGALVVEVPGGMQLLALERTSGHVKVRTFDGKEGWIEAKKVK